MINIENMNRAYSEVYAILNVLGEDYKNKIPSKIYNTIIEERDVNYNPVYDTNIILGKEQLSHEAITLIAMINMQCWASPNEKKELKKIYYENERKYQEFLNPFKDSKKVKENYNDIIKEDGFLMEKKEQNIFVKILNKIKFILKIKK